MSSREGLTPVAPRPAASVVLVRPGAAGPLEVYLVRRAAAMRFLGGYYAFPGGKVDLPDRGPEALAHTCGIAPDTARQRLDDPADEVPALAYWVTAVRELFEETGLLVAMDAAGHPVDVGAPGLAGRLEAERRRIVAGERSFTAFLAEEGWVADLSSLAYLAQFVTPPASPIRFAARFFLCPVPAGQAPRLVLEEASEGFWVDPAHAYARFRAREWPMAEPAEYAMRYLAQFESYAGVWTHHAAGQPAFHGIIDRLDAARYYRFDWDTVVRRG
jgi:8-oxo-dGTP pyrophosphatase MutT (NUDIX family)